MLGEDSIHLENVPVPLQSTGSIKKTLGSRIQLRINSAICACFPEVFPSISNRENRSPKTNAGSKSAGCKAVNNPLLPGEICSVKNQ